MRVHASQVAVRHAFPQCADADADGRQRVGLRMTGQQDAAAADPEDRLHRRAAGDGRDDVARAQTFHRDLARRGQDARALGEADGERA